MADVQVYVKVCDFCGAVSTPAPVGELSGNWHEQGWRRDFVCGWKMGDSCPACAEKYIQRLRTQPHCYECDKNVITPDP